MIEVRDVLRKILGIAVVQERDSRAIVYIRILARLDGLLKCNCEEVIGIRSFERTGVQSGFEYMIGSG